MSGRSREQDERQDEQGTGDIGQHAGIHAGDLGSLKGDENHEAIAKNVVVEGTQELGQEKRCEAALPEQSELAG